MNSNVLTPSQQHRHRAFVAHALKQSGLGAVHTGAINNYAAAVGGLAARGRTPMARDYLSHITAPTSDIHGQNDIDAGAKKLLDSGLLGHADRQLQSGVQRGYVRGHVPLPPFVPKDTRGFVHLTPEEVAHAKQQDRDSITESLKDFTPTIKPATGETLPIASGHYQTTRKANRDAAAASVPPFETVPADATPDTAPLPLSDGPDEPKTKQTASHRYVILRHAVNRVPAGEIAKRLAAENGISPKTAAKHVAAFFATRALHAQPVDTSVTKLARKTPVKPAEVTEAGGVHPSIAGTRLAKHLKDLYVQYAKPRGTVALGSGPKKIVGKDDTGRTVVDYGGEHGHVPLVPPPGGKLDAGQHPIAAAADNILRNGASAGHVKGLDGGSSFADLSKLLEQEKHPLAGQYNWDKMGKTLAADQRIGDFIKKTFVKPEGMTDRQFWAKVADKYTQEAVDKDHLDRRYADPEKRAAHLAQHAEFWRRAGQSLHKDDLKKLNDAIYRHHALAEDREDFAKHGLPALDVKANVGGIKGIPGNKALKFSREEMASLSLLCRLNPGVRKELAGMGVTIND